MGSRQKVIPDSLFKLAVDTWFEFYEKKTGEQYSFTPKDGYHLKLLLKKIRIKMVEKEYPTTDENLNMGLRVFLNTITDPWFLRNLEISIINGKFNILYQSAKSKQRSSNADYYQSKYGNGTGLSSGQ